MEKIHTQEAERAMNDHKSCFVMDLLVRSVNLPVSMVLPVGWPRDQFVRQFPPPDLEHSAQKESTGILEFCKSWTHSAGYRGGNGVQNMGILCTFDGLRTGKSADR